MGEALYQEASFFANDLTLVDAKMQNLIKQYRFCKEFNCPPYPSLQEVPIKTIDSFMIIDAEIKKHNQKVKNG